MLAPTNTGALIGVHRKYWNAGMLALKMFSKGSRDRSACVKRWLWFEIKRRYSYFLSFEDFFEKSVFKAGVCLHNMKIEYNT